MSEIKVGDTDYKDVTPAELIQKFIDVDYARGYIERDYNLEWFDGIPAYLETLPADALRDALYELAHKIYDLEFKLYRATWKANAK